MRAPDSISVLFIDDEAGQRELTKYWLGERLGFNVKTVRSTLEGLEELKTGNIEAVVTDFQMPEVDGLEFLRKVRRDHPRMPFFFLSTRSMDNIIIEAMNNGADGFLMKSADVEPLYTDMAVRIKTMVRRVREGEVLSEAIESLSRQSTTMSILNQILLEASHSEDLPQMLERTLDITIGLMDFDGGWISLVDDKKNYAKLAHHRSIPDALAKAVGTVPLGAPPYNRVFVEKSPLFIEKDDVLAAAQLNRNGYSSVCSVPILSRGNVIGSLNLVRKRPYGLTDLDKSILVSIGLDLGDCLERVVSGEEMRRVLANMEILFDSIDELIFILEPNGKLLKVNRSALMHTGYSQEELEGMDALLLSPLDERDDGREALESIATRTNRSFNGHLLCKDGSLLKMETQISRGFWNGMDVIVAVCRDTTEADRSSRSLEESERKYRLIAENSTDVIWKLDLASQKFTYISPSIEKLRGLTVAEAMAENLADSVTLDTLVDIRKSLEDGIRRLKEGDMTSISSVGLFQQRHKDGHWVTVETATTLIKDNDGGVREVLGVSRDASARVRSEQDLKEKSDEVERFFGLALDLLCIANMEGRFIRLNKAWEATLGYKLEELQGANFLDFVHPDDKERTMKAVSSLSDKQDVLDFVNRYRRKDGTYRWIEWRSTPHENLIYAAARDITERKQIEESLIRSEEKLNLAIEGSEAGLWDWKVQTGELEINERWAEIIGYSIQELSPLSIKTWEEFTHPDDLKRSTQLLESYFQGKIDHYECEVRMRHKNGHWIWILDKGRISASDDRGRPLRMNGTHQDITERKKTEDALIQVNNKLNLLSSITRHDIQNQIMILSGNISMVRSGDERVDVPTSLEKMERAVMNIQRQIQFTKDYQNMGVKKPEWFNVSHLIRRGFETLNQSDLALEDRTAGYEIFADPLIEKVFYNLLDNSIRHGGKVRNIITRCEMRHGTLVIVYQDDGTGISPEKRKRLFEKGFGANTGLGLFLSREILGITSIGITEKGEQGGGVRFELEVPNDAWRPVPE